MAVSGKTLVVGAYLEDSNATGVNGGQVNNGAADSGAAYVFVRSGSSWSLQAYLKASNPEEDDHFAHALGLSGDSLVAAAPSEDSQATGVDGDDSDNSAFSAGAAYVFDIAAVTPNAWTDQGCGLAGVAGVALSNAIAGVTP